MCLPHNLKMQCSTSFQLHVWQANVWDAQREHADCPPQKNQTDETNCQKSWCQTEVTLKLHQIAHHWWFAIGLTQSVKMHNIA